VLKTLPLGGVVAGIGTHSWPPALIGLAIFVVLVWIDLVRQRDCLKSRERREAMFLRALARERDKNGRPDAVVEIARVSLQPELQPKIQVGRRKTEPKQ
jgi:hypothetical protein